VGAQEETSPSYAQHKYVHILASLLSFLQRKSKTYVSFVPGHKAAGVNVISSRMVGGSHQQGYPSRGNKGGADSVLQIAI
jgi:hypothetical protein